MVSKAALAVAGILGLIAVVSVLVVKAKGTLTYDIQPRLGVEGLTVFTASGRGLPNTATSWQVLEPTNRVFVELKRTTSDAEGFYSSSITAPISFFGVGVWSTRVQQLPIGEPLTSNTITIEVVPFR